MVFLRGTPRASITMEIRKKGAIPPPEVTFAANPQSITLGESSTLTWTTTNADSVTIDNGISSVDLNRATTVSPTETTTYTLTATGLGGTATDSVTLTVSTVLAINITSHYNGDTVSIPDVMIEGTITNTTDNETGVTFNGFIAMVHGKIFVANNVPLEEGENTITATATDSQGNTASTSIILYAETEDEYVSITADTESGISPLETTLRIDASFSFTESSLTDTGPSAVEILERTESEYRVRMTTPGIYYVTIEVEDDQGNTYTDTISVVVLDEAELDTLLKTRWNGMKAALGSQDIEQTISYFTEETRDLYKDIYIAIYDRLPQIVQDMSEIQLIYTEGGFAKYRIRRNELNGGQTYAITYYVYFKVDMDGLWRILRY